MSDFDNIREDRYSDQVEREEAEKEFRIASHTDNWMTAVTQSVEKSHGTFEDVTDYDSKLDNRGFQKRKAKSTDVFIEELHNKNFMERAAKILIDLQKKFDGFYDEPISQLFSDMAYSYAEYQYESNLKD